MHTISSLYAQNKVNSCVSHHSLVQLKFAANFGNNPQSLDCEDFRDLSIYANVAATLPSPIHHWSAYVLLYKQSSVEVLIGWSDWSLSTVLHMCEWLFVWASHITDIMKWSHAMMMVRTSVTYMEAKWEYTGPRYVQASHMQSIFFIFVTQDGWGHPFTSYAC